jgi:hypothetical protein
MSRLDMKIHEKNQPHRFIMNAALISCFAIGIKYGYLFASSYNLWIQIISSLAGGFFATFINEEVYYWSRNSNKSIRTLACVFGSFAGAILTVLFFKVIKIILNI